MNFARSIAAMCLLAFAGQANADWLNTDITSIINNVQAIYDQVTGDAKDMSKDFKRQLTLLQQQGDTVKETVDDALGLMQHRRTPFLDFVGGSAARCGQGSTCWNFRADLAAFVLDFADLRNRFPQIDQYGLGDGEPLADIINYTPPLVLFGLYDFLRRVPNWQDIPEDLASLYDEIGDPDAFSLELPAARLLATVARSGSSSANAFSSPDTRANAFCSKGKQPKWDVVRVNRLKAFFVLSKDIFDSYAEYVPESQTGEVAGEGASVPLPMKGVLKSVTNTIDAILAFMDAHRTNLDVCKQIETDVAQCTKMVTYRTSAGVAKAYWVVSGILKSRQADGLDESAATTDLTRAVAKANASNWRDAYDKICTAYSDL